MATPICRANRLLRIGSVMTRARSRSMSLCMLLPLMALSACSKTVQWEEEVPLNTGEVIWVKRSVDYVLKGAGGNPLDIAYRPEWVEKLEFEWSGKKYVYDGDANVILLAISPQKQPVLVARASDKNWEMKHKYQCSTTSYVQLIPDTKGRTWTWPAGIETWLYGLPANLMLERKKPAEMKKRYLAQERKTEDAGVSSSLARIDPLFTFTEDCKGLKS